MMKKLALLSFIVIGAAFISCQKEITEIQKEDGISEADLNKIKSLDLNTNDVEYISFELPDGNTTKNAYLIEKCISIDPDHLHDMDLHGGVTSEQYRTYNLVSSPRTIRVLGYTGGSYALTAKMQTGLQWAVANYNALPLGLNFVLTFGTNTGANDIVVYQLSGGAGGSAGFPSGGNPYKWVRIYSGLAPYSYNVHEHVIGHEIGHCLGLRHTDWFSRASCGTYSPEPVNPYGAVWIPGTPTGYDSNSLMLSCFTSSEDGEFGYYDRVALNYLY